MSTSSITSVLPQLWAIKAPFSTGLYGASLKLLSCVYFCLTSAGPYRVVPIYFIHAFSVRRGKHHFAGRAILCASLGNCKHFSYRSVCKAAQAKFAPIIRTAFSVKRVKPNWIGAAQRSFHKLSAANRAFHIISPRACPWAALSRRCRPGWRPAPRRRPRWRL